MFLFYVPNLVEIFIDYLAKLCCIKSPRKFGNLPNEGRKLENREKNLWSTRETNYCTSIDPTHISSKLSWAITGLSDLMLINWSSGEKGNMPTAACIHHLPPHREHGRGKDQIIYSALYSNTVYMLYFHALTELADGTRQSEIIKVGGLIQLTNYNFAI